MSIHTVEIALPSGITIVEIRQGPAGSDGSSTWDSLTGTASQVPFEPVTPPAYAEGLAFYDTDDKSLVYYNDEPDVAMNIGRELWVRVRNDSGAPILNGKVVYINDALGQLPTIRLARADSAVTSRVIGIATHDIGNNEFGYVTTAGEVKGLNTVAFQDGDLLFLSATNAGEMTTTAPTAPNRVIQVATVLHAHISQGKLYCHPENDSVPSTGIVDSTATGRALITAATAGAARITLGLSSGDSVTFGSVSASGLNSNGAIVFNGLNAGDSMTFNMVNYAYGAGAAAAHRTALGLGAGDTPTFYGLDLIDGTTTTLNVYNVLSGANFERLSFRWASNVAFIGTSKGGTGTTGRDLVIETDGTERARFTAAGIFSVYGVTFGRGGGAVATNTAAGASALNANTTGALNAAMGQNALLANTTGSSNTAAGQSSLSGNTTGNDNAAFGRGALSANTLGSGNTTVGQNSLSFNTTGNSNTALGNTAGRNIADGTSENAVTSNSVYIGAGTKALASGQTNQIVIGHNTIGLGSHSATLGNDSVTLTALKGNVVVHRGAQNAVDFERLGMRWVSFDARFGTTNGGSSPPRDVVLETGGTERVRVLASNGNVGVGTQAPASRFTVTGGDIEATGISTGIILKSPDGTRYRVTVANGGTLSVAAVAAP